MKKLFLVLTLTLALNSFAQTNRYFEFISCPGAGNWQDTSFIVAASNQALIDTVLAELAKPIKQRRFILGSIDYGNGGHNHNASHLFLWHFIPNQWSLVEASIELCDGCPYSAVDADTSFWVGNLGTFCPWTSMPVREVSNTLGINDFNFRNEVTIYPNPASDKLNLRWTGLNNISVTICNSIGQELITIPLFKGNKMIDITTLRSGLYFVKSKPGNQIVKKLIVENK